MANELLEFTGKKDFEDLQFGKGYNLTEDDITAFKADCMRINNLGQFQGLRLSLILRYFDCI